MAKTNHCPFTHKLCGECSLYRGRHLYINSSRQCNLNNPKGHSISDWQVSLSEFKKLIESLKNNNKRNENLKIRVKVINMETEEERIFGVEELNKLDWNVTDIWRLIDGQQIRSLNHFIDILNHKADKGVKEVEIYEGPRFMLLAGG